VFFLGLGERLRAPGMPIRGIVHVHAQVRAGFFRQKVEVFFRVGRRLREKEGGREKTNRERYEAYHGGLLAEIRLLRADEDDAEADVVARVVGWQMLAGRRTAGAGGVGPAAAAEDFFFAVRGPLGIGLGAFFVVIAVVPIGAP